MSRKTNTSKPKNRLYKGSKYSEYKIDQLVRCFADDLNAKDAATKTKISVRSVRPIYKKLRLKLLSAATADKAAFGYAGTFLNVLHHSQLERLRASEVFAQRVQEHFPRAPKPDTLNANDTASLDVTLLLVEMVIRECSQTEFVKGDGFDQRIIYLQKMVERTGLNRFAEWWEEKGQSIDLDSQDEITVEAISLHHKMAEMVADTITMEMDQLIGKTHLREYSGDVVYRDLRKYLLKKPV